MDVNQVNEEPLSETLCELVDAEQGAWKRKQVQALHKSSWAKWFEARLAGEDSYFGYDREERREGRANLFHDLFSTLRDLNTEEAAEGLALYLGSLSDNLETHETRLREAVDLVQHVRARDTSGREPLRARLKQWITENKLREAYDGSEATDLHRRVLWALVFLQKQGDESDREMWEEHVEEEAFAVAAFSGLALSLEGFERAEGMVRKFIDLVDDSDPPIDPRNPLEALFVGGRDRSTVMHYTWNEVHRDGEPSDERARADWQRLEDWLDRVVELPSYERMQKRIEQNPLAGWATEGVAAGETLSAPWRADYGPTRGVGRGKPFGENGS